MSHTNTSRGAVATFVGKAIVVVVSTAAVASVGVLGVAPQAQADDGSYLSYLRNHGVFIPPHTERNFVRSGHMQCEGLRHGKLTRQMMVDYLPRNIWGDPAVAYDALRELCPDVAT